MQISPKFTFFHKLPPALPPFRQLLCIRLLYACTLVDAVHQVITQPVPVVDPLHHPLVIPNLATERKIYLKSEGDFFKASRRCLTSQKLSLEMSTIEPSQEPDMVLLLMRPLLCKMWNKKLLVWQGREFPKCFASWRFSIWPMLLSATEKREI